LRRLADPAGVLRQQLGPDFELAVAAYKNGCDYEALGREFGLVDQEIRQRIRRAWRRVIAIAIGLLAVGVG